VGDDSLGDAWKANVKGLPEVIAQRLVIHDTQEDAFYEELQQSVRLVVLSSSLPFPSSRRHHIPWIQHPLQQDGGVNAPPAVHRN
jgi:desulfoferrodoxin (superoxide reductase-like protein)